MTTFKDASKVWWENLWTGRDLDDSSAGYAMLAASFHGGQAMWKKSWVGSLKVPAQGCRSEHLEKHFLSVSPELKLCSKSDLGDKAYATIHVSATCYVEIDASDEKMYVRINTTSEEKHFAYAKLMDRLFTSDPPRGTVYMMVSGQSGPKFQAFAEGGRALERGNYTPKVLAAYDRIKQEISGPNPRGRLTILNGPAGSGKCLGRGTPVLMFDGSVVPVENIRPGDLLMGPDSKPRTVLSTNTDTGPLFRITPTKGDSWVCNDVHILTLKHTDSKKIRDVCLKDFLTEKPKDQFRWKQIRTGVEFPEQKNFIDPYFFGLWIGDGSKSKNIHEKLATVSVSKPDKEVLDECESIAQMFGLIVKNRAQPHKCPTYAIVKNERTSKENSLLSLFRSNLPEDLSIPRSFLVNSRENRLAFLAGLLDSDGCYNCGGYEIAQKRNDYANDILFLARSLGFAAYLKKKVVNGTEYNRISISGDLNCVPTRIPRKKAPPRKQVKDVLITGIRTESIGDGEYFGFTLDGDGRFLLGDFTVTHNTSLVRGLLQETADTVFLIIPQHMIAMLGDPSCLSAFTGLRDSYDTQPFCAILEDCDDALAPRQQGDTSVMSSILNLGDGITGALLDIRLVATTNRERQEFDAAILRPGRLSTSTEVGALPPEQVSEVYKRLTGKDKSFNKEHTIAEVYQMAFDTEWEKTESTQRKMGF